MPIAVVQHIDPRHQGLMAQILGRQSSLPVAQAADDEPLTAGRVYVAPPDFHIEVSSGRVRAPHAAIETGAVDYVLPLDDIAPTLIDLAGVAV